MHAVDYAPVSAAEVDALAALAGVIWRQHYPALISAAQIDYMLAQRYAPAVILAGLTRGEWWDGARREGHLVGFAHAYQVVRQATPRTTRPAWGAARTLIPSRGHSHPQDAGEWKLDKLYVHADLQRRGIGGRLIERVACHARSQGGRTLVLRVNRRNANALGAYAKHGFRIQQEVLEDIGNGFLMDDYLMVKEL